jgi:hypothetical protein
MDQHIFELNDDWEVVLTLNPTFYRAYVNLRHKGQVSPSGSTKVLVQQKHGGRACYVSTDNNDDPCEVAIIANTNYEVSDESI